jgi:hypothetical protein
MTKNHRQGGKIGGDHTTLLDLAVTMVDIAASYSEVKTISPGHIKVNPDKSGGARRVKFAWIMGGLLMTIRQNRSVQEVRVYTTNTQTTMVALARAARDLDIPIGFLKKDKTQAY